jgi:hypothetical protein
VAFPDAPDWPEVLNDRWFQAAKACGNPDRAIAGRQRELFDADAAMAHPISASAALIWEECNGSQTIEAIVEKVGAVYDAPAETIARDAEALLRHLSELGLIVLVDGAGD